MPAGRRPLSEYRGMWLFAMFDLPVDSRKARRAYTRLRKALKRQGFSMLQFSVYARYFASEDGAVSHRRRIRELVPPRGHVRLLSVTDRQFGKMEVFLGEGVQEPEKPPRQVELF